ncbi:MAG: transposase [Gammaproteobacteria bacterium]
MRLYFSSFAYVVMETLRALGLSGTEIAQAQCGTIRRKLFKIGVQVRLSVRKIWIAFSESYPYARQEARPGVDVKLLPRDGELYVYAQSRDRVAKGSQGQGLALLGAAVQMLDVHHRRPGTDPPLLESTVGVMIREPRSSCTS